MFLLSFSVSSFAASSGAIVVTIKPLYSLVAQLTDGIEEPVLLMKTIQSPHHYNMRPSERRLLSDAKMIIWLGPNLESYLTKIIRQQDQTTVVTAIQAEGLVLLETLLEDRDANTGVFPIEWQNFLRQFPRAQTPRLLLELAALHTRTAESSAIHSTSASQ